MSRFAAALALLCLPAAALAQSAASPELARALARAWSLPPAEVESLAVASGADLQDLAVASLVARTAGRPVAEVWQLRAGERSWESALSKAGLDPAALVAGVKGRLSPATWSALLDKGEPVGVAALVRTLERLTGRAAEPLARELSRRAFTEYFAELAGVKLRSGSAPGAPAAAPGSDLAPPGPKNRLVLPYPGYQPGLSGSQPPPSSVPTTPK